MKHEEPFARRLQNIVCESGLQRPIKEEFHGVKQVSRRPAMNATFNFGMVTPLMLKK